MQKSHIVLWFSTTVIAVLVVGCVQPASDEVAPQQVGSNATWTVTPSSTPVPPNTDTPTPTVGEADAQAEPVTPTETATATPTDAMSALIGEETLVAEAAGQDEIPPLDEGEDVQPAEEPGQQINEFEMTATAIVAGATATQAAQQTATALAAGIGLPTPTPTPSAAPLEPGQPGVNTPIPATRVPGQDCIHEVRAGENLYRLSLAYGVPIMDIAQASGIVNPDQIRVGQRLTIPGCGTTGGVPPATSTPGPSSGGTGGPSVPAPPGGDCSWGTSVQFPNGCPSATQQPGTGGPTTGSTPVASRTHVVQQGETLFEISLAYGVDVADIARLNGITNYDSIRFNQELLIP